MLLCSSKGDGIGVVDDVSDSLVAAACSMSQLWRFQLSGISKLFVKWFSSLCQCWRAGG
jgi:hypothetical protein